MPVPAFGDGGLLPAGRHEATVEDVRAALVDAFEGSSTRAAIFSYWRDLREALGELVPVHAQWLDGSFTTDKPDPADLDLVTVVDGPAFDALPRHRRLLVASLIEGTYTEQFWSCDSNPLARYPEGDLGHHASVVVARRWESYFGHTRDGAEKGFVEVAE
jgi:hypothetical protein